MNITDDIVRYAAGLSKLEISEDEIPGLVRDMSRILEYMETMNGPDTDNAKPTPHVFMLKNVLREDETGVSLDRDLLLSNAPAKENFSFTVPKTVE
jgi:aspartyl-tRNA(Asn)/glutamyl-tRNA(Gln) amidotransferase subunit C